MKTKKRIYTPVGKTQRNYIPFRYAAAIFVALLETATIINIVIVLCYCVPYFYLAVWATEIACVIRIIASEDNPDYKIPWLLFVLILPIAGFMLYFLFYSRTLKKKYIKRLDEIKNNSYKKDDSRILERLNEENPVAYSQAKMLCNISESHLFTGIKQTYFSVGEDMYRSLIEDLKKAKKFIFMEYFIIEEGIFWNSVLEVLKEKTDMGVEVKVIYDDIGCMMTLPGNYYKILREFRIDAVPFSILKGNADSEFNNRSHRKITVIDGVIGYTGGINLADEYINEIVKHGHWKDTGIRIEGEAVKELTRLFLIDFGINKKSGIEISDKYYPKVPINEEMGYVIPFGDGPRPIYSRNVGKSVIQNLLAGANRYMNITTPYLIIDNEMCQSIENAALRGVKVRIIVPHIPDKKLIFAMTRSYYKRLLDAGVEIYEYAPGFIHAKSYVADGEYAMIGTINLDYRSLVHHFENGVWMYRCACISDMEKDFENTISKSIKIEPSMLKINFIQKFIFSVVKIFSPLL